MSIQIPERTYTRAEVAQILKLKYPQLVYRCKIGLYPTPDVRITPVRYTYSVAQLQKVIEIHELYSQANMPHSKIVAKLQQQQGEE